jgi:hypothetical protein
MKVAIVMGSITDRPFDNIVGGNHANTSSSLRMASFVAINES